MKAIPLYRRHETAFCTQYGELKERTLTAGALLPGAPGTLHRRQGTGYAYWYRVYYPTPGKQAETLVGRHDDSTAETVMRQRIAFSAWSGRQVVALRKLGFSVADKACARVLVELHNLGAFSAGLVVVGTLGHMAWHNELGIEVRARREAAKPRARQPGLEFGASRAWLQSPVANTLPFARVASEPATTTVARLAGVRDLRIEFGVPADAAGNDVGVGGDMWSARSEPFHEFLLESPESGAVLAGGHCIPVLLPQAARLVWHTLFLSSQPGRLPAQAARERQLSLALGAALIDHDPWALLTAWERAPSAMTAMIRPLRTTVLAELAGYPELCDLFDDCLRGG
ncbi:hypothetical protein LZ012_01850 [Dechloromonas sp. XY25]|uniref:Uncharacterized protein n=1 Tax=Dechloromonas hankyongensis TaxID=2908002 RepID=A0ABS9JXV6_9RHOO|nr:hypothetical protein [Dechloromonas hankyongensis]MCG2575733.1 hypothetical protein [Dechloromonas hankyongensis]